MNIMNMLKAAYGPYGLSGRPMAQSTSSCPPLDVCQAVLIQSKLLSVQNKGLRISCGVSVQVESTFVRSIHSFHTPQTTPSFKV